MKCFAIGFSESFWVDVLTKLQDEHQINPVYITALPEYLTQYRKLFNQAVVHDLLKAARGIPAPQWQDHPDLWLDEEVLRKYCYEQYIATSMMNRMDPGGNFLFEERLRLFHRQLTYWHQVINHLQPDVVFMPTTPHAVYDYVIFALCQKLNIPTLMFSFTSFNKYYLRRDIENALGPARKEYWETLKNGLPEFNLSDQLKEHFSKITHTKDASSYLFTRKFNLTKWDHNKGLTKELTLKKLILVCIQSCLDALNIISRPAPENVLKQKGKSIERSDVTALGFQLTRVRAKYYKKSLARFLAKLVQLPDLEQPFIYVPLHYQPENTTSPNGGIFENQILLVRILSGCLPKGWNIYVKEYPFQFNKRTKGEMARNRQFYLDLKAIPGVRLIPKDFNSMELTDSCRAVATVTGTAGWEAVCRGKPVMLFGTSWYLGCEGVYRVRTTEDCRKAMKVISKGKVVDHDKVRYFAHVVESHCLDVYARSNWINVHVKDLDEHNRKLAAILAQAAWGEREV